MFRAAVVVAVLTGLPLLGLASQGRDVLAPGDRVRVGVSTNDIWGRRIVGTVLTDADDSLRLQTESGASVAIVRTAIMRLEISRGKHPNTGGGALIGCVVGEVVGVAAGLASGDDRDQLFGFTAGEKALLYGVAGLAGGALLGSMIGESSLVDRWQAVPVRRTRISLAPRGLGLAVSLAR